MPGAVAMLASMPVAAFALIVGGGIWLLLWRTRWRLWGMAPIAAGALWAMATPALDIVVAGDGRHLAVRTASGDVAILRGRAGDYVRDMLSETSGSDAELLEIQDLQGAACSKDLCAADLAKEGRLWRVLATRSSHLVDISPMKRACAAADIIVSDRWLPRTCRPRWLKLDRPFLARSGGVAIVLAERPRMSTVAERVGEHPWAAPIDQGRKRLGGMRYRPK